MSEAVVEKRTRATSVKDVSADVFIAALAAHLKKTGKVELPAYVDYVKTASFKEYSPLDNDWYYLRAAAIARRVYLQAGVGVGEFRRKFGGRSHKKGKVAPEHFARASGGIIRHALKELEKVGLVEKHATGGRRITSEGRRQLDLVAGACPLATFNVL